MDKHEAIVAKVTRALTDAGLNPQDIGGGIMNLYAAPSSVAKDEPDTDDYLGTVTVTITP